MVVARDAARLDSGAEAVRAAHGVRVEVLPADLTTDTGRECVAAWLRDPDRSVDLVINSAGLSLNTPFSAPAWRRCGGQRAKLEVQAGRLRAATSAPTVATAGGPRHTGPDRP